MDFYVNVSFRYHLQINSPQTHQVCVITKIFFIFHHLYFIKNNHGPCTAPCRSKRSHVLLCSHSVHHDDRMPSWFKAPTLRRFRLQCLRTSLRRHEASLFWLRKASVTSRPDCSSHFKSYLHVETTSLCVGTHRFFPCVVVLVCCIIFAQCVFSNQILQLHFIPPHLHNLDDTRAPTT